MSLDTTHKKIVATLLITAWLCPGFVSPIENWAQNKSPGAINDQNPYQPTTTANIRDIRQAISTGNLNLAQSLLTSAMGAQSANAELHFLQGRVYQEKRSNTKAIASYSIAIFLQPGNPANYINRALVKGALQDLDGAKEDLDLALTLSRNNATAFLNRGVTMAAMNKPQAALTDFNQAIAIKPYFSEAYRNRGITKNFLGDRQAACADWHRAVTLGDTEVTSWVTFFCDGNQSKRQPQRGKGQ
jgi:tetratricopeptide (TPR) repeat protein